MEQERSAGEPDNETHTSPKHGVTRPTSRRSALMLLGGAGVGALAAACGSSDAATSATTTTTKSSGSVASTTSTAAAGSTATTVAAGDLSEIPEETAGPYPGDGSNGVNVLNQDGIVRSNITSSFGSASGVAGGVPLQIDLKIVDAGSGSAVDGAAVYVWHCDREGRYSLYSQGVTNENYLRGVQVADGDGNVSFTSIYPAAYSGRWPHIHFEVYSSVADATGGGEPIATSQLALTEDVSDAVYATDGYSQSVRNMDQTSLESDMVFRDGAELETPTMTGDVSSGYVASLTVAV